MSRIEIQVTPDQADAPAVHVVCTGHGTRRADDICAPRAFRGYLLHVLYDDIEAMGPCRIETVLDGEKCMAADVSVDEETGAFCVRYDDGGEGEGQDPDAVIDALVYRALQSVSASTDPADYEVDGDTLSVSSAEETVSGYETEEEGEEDDSFIATSDSEPNTDEES